MTDNGPQFVSDRMFKFCETHNIDKVQTAPYSPQSNRLVERLHGTLTPMIQKCIEHKTEWAEVIPYALYFIRMSPNSSSGFSPFLIMHGWELVTPVQLLFKGWVGEESKTIDLQEWIMENMERVQDLRDKTVGNYMEAMEKWKVVLDRRAQERIV